MKNKLLIRFKKITSYVIALSMIALSFPLAPTVFAVGTPTVTIGSQTASNGSSINVPISASNFANTVAGMDFTVQYDPTLLTYTGLTQNAISGHGTLTTGTTTNTVIMNWFDNAALSLDGGAILTLNFTVISASTTNANLTFSGTGLSDAIGDPISPTSFVDGVISLNAAKAITAFSFSSPAATGVINEGAKTVAITVPYGTNVTALVPTITVSEGASISPLSGAAQNFTSPVTYTVTSADSTTQEYIVTVTVAANPAKAITSFSFDGLGVGTIDEGNHTIIVNVPFETDETSLTASFVTTGASVAIGATPQVSGVTVNNFHNSVVYTVTAADSTTQNYTVTVNVAANPAKAITAFSFSSPAATGVIDEGAHTIAVTVPYGTNVTALVASFTTTGYLVHIGATTQVSGVTPNNFTSPVIYTVDAADATTQTYVVTVTVAANTAKAITAFDLTSPDTTGVINEGAHTISLTVPYETDVTTLVPTITITGESISPASGVSSNFTSPVTYTVTAANSSTQAYVVTVNVAAPSTVNTVTSGTYTINDGASTITGVPYATASSTFLSAITKGEPNQTWDISGLSNPVVTGNVLVVTAQSGATKTYTLTVALNPAKDITSFSFPMATSTISGTNIAAEVPFGTAVTALVPTIVLSGGTVSPLSGVAQDFTNPVTYTVTAADSSTKVYTVTVTIAPDPIEAAFSAVSSTLSSSSGVVNNLNTVTSYNYTNFSGLFFEKRTDVTASSTAVGSITFSSALDLSSDETIAFLQNLGTKMDANTTGAISLDFTGQTASTTLMGASATIKFYGLNHLGFNASSTAEEINAKLVAFEDDGVTPIDISTLVPSPGTYLGACEVNGGCYVFTVGVNHFTGYQIDNTAPTNQNTVFASSVSKKGGTSVTIVSSGDITNNIWFAPSGTSIFTESATTTKAVNGTSTSILAPANEGAYKLYVVDSVGNVSAASTATLTVDDTAPTIVMGDPSISSTNSGPITYAITYSGADTVTLANSNITLNTTGTATGTIAVTGTGNTTRTVTISNIAGNGTLGISVAAATASDSAGNTALAAGPSTTFIVDNIAPTVTKIGNDSADVTIASSTDDTLTFSETLSTAGKTAVQTALTNGADKTITYSWDASSTILTITGHATDVTTFANDVSANVTDIAGNSAVLLLIDSNLAATQTAPDGSGVAAISTTTPQVVITNPTQAVTITVDSGTSNPTIDVSSFIGSNGTGTLPAINITSANANNTTVAISASTTVISADATWDGVIAAPTVTTVTIPATSGQTKTFSTAIQVGFTGAKLSFDNAVKILLPGQADKRAGYIRDGIAFTEITTTCGENSQNWADSNLGVDGDCKINSGSDLVIWTKHFTSFATYTQTTNSTGGGGGGGAPAVSCTSVVYGEWGAVFNGIQYRNILSQTPLGCSITANQRLDGSRIYQSTDEPVVEQNVGVQASAGTIRVTAEEKELTSKIDSKLIKRLAGRILLQVERFGQAWYLDAISLERYYLADGPTAYEALRKFGLGIKNVDLDKIPVALDSVLPGDYSTSTMPVSSALVNRLKGRIVIQVENHGEAWYINPVNGQRYYLANGEAAYQIMRSLSLGISDINIRKITVGSWE